MMGPRYEALRTRYVEELREASHQVDDWWAALVALTLARTGSRPEAERALRRRWPVGPSAHPRILAVVRKYFLACAALNEEVGAAAAARPPGRTRHVLDAGQADEVVVDQPVGPSVLVEESLYTEGTQDLARIVGKLSYWPVGVDERGRFT